MGSPAESHRGAVCSTNPNGGVFHFQSSQHLKRFIMFDHSNGKGRVFFHPAAAQELFGSVRSTVCQGSPGEKQVIRDVSSSSLAAHRQVIEGAFSSLQCLRTSRQSAPLLQRADVSTLSSMHISSRKPRVSETMSTNDDKDWALDAEDASLQHVAFETLDCEEESKVAAIPPSAETTVDCTHHISPGCSIYYRSKVSGMKLPKVAESSQPMPEDTHDLDALLSSDEDEDDDVRSTAHSPQESFGEKDRGNDDEVDESTLSGVRIPLRKPRVSETMSTNDEAWALDAEDASLPHVAFETLDCEEELKVAAILPSAKTALDCTNHISLGRSNSCRSKVSGLKLPEVAESSEPMPENTHDLDALLSSDEDEDDDVRSTAYSPEEAFGKKDGGNDDEVDDIEHNPCKRRRILDECDVQSNVKFVGVSKDWVDDVDVGHLSDPKYAQSIRKQKIKRIVKALRRVIPGGALLDTAFVLDRTISYVKDLRQHVNQLESMRFQSQLYNHRP